MWEDLLCHADESGLHDEEPLKGSEQKRGSASFVAKNYLPGGPGWELGWLEHRPSNTPGLRV